MSVLTHAIEACLSPVTGDGQGGFSASATFPADFIGFKGHFPGRPVLPGVCMVQTALVILALGRAEPVTLKCLVSAKWMAPVLPGEALVFTLTVGGRNAPPEAVRVSVLRGPEKVAEFLLETQPGSRTAATA